MAAISPFGALRYDEAVAGPLADLVAPPYDVIDNDELETLALTSEHNIVHLTRPVSAGAAAARLGEWRASGVLRDEEPALWWLVQDYAAGDGVTRLRAGIAGSIPRTSS